MNRNKENFLLHRNTVSILAGELLQYAVGEGDHHLLVGQLAGALIILKCKSMCTKCQGLWCCYDHCLGITCLACHHPPPILPVQDDGGAELAHVDDLRFVIRPAIRCYGDQGVLCIKQCFLAETINVYS